MTDQEIIEAKSKEIKRLHQVCNEKDDNLRHAINIIKIYAKNSEGELQQTIQERIDYLNNTLG
jgi:hypothetical protein